MKTESRNKSTKRRLSSILTRQKELRLLLPQNEWKKEGQQQEIKEMLLISKNKHNKTK